MRRDPTPLPGYVHPSATAYRAGCGCVKCFRRNKAIYSRRAAYGTDLVDADPARVVVRQFYDEGFSYLQMASATGVPQETARDLLRPGVRRRMNRHDVHKLAAMTRTALLEQAPDLTMVPTVGTHRRIQALQYNGWSIREIAGEDYGQWTKIVLRQSTQARHYRWMCARFAEIWDKPGASRWTHFRAVRLGYAPALAWDDIDDPDAVPNLGGPALTRRMRLYMKGYTDKQLARDSHEGIADIVEWRTRYQLPENHQRRDQAS